ncbi:hypothetical protein C6P40_004318, partial [Pichia californica]
STVNGFNAIAYSLSDVFDAITDCNYIGGAYTTLPVVSSTTIVPEYNFIYDFGGDNFWAGFKFTPYTGIYTFEVTTRSNYFSFWIGDAAFVPCSNTYSSDSYKDILLSDLNTGEIITDSNSYAYLEANLYYPFRIVTYGIGDLQEGLIFKFLFGDNWIDIQTQVVLDIP